VVQDGIAHWAHVGDSRLYHLREGRIESQTRDHSNVQRLLDTGRISREAASSHPERNRIYSCLGGTVPPKVALSHGARLLAGDTILLCTDGLWGPITSQQICALLTKSDIMLAVPELLDLAEIRAGQDCDNLSAVAMTWTEQGGA
jgi:serine/threonine protein phosphatase PrpC